MTREACINVGLSGRSYKIAIGVGLIDRADQEIAPLFRSADAIIITDSHVAVTGHLERLQDALARAAIGQRVFTVPAGEASKSFESFQKLTDAILTSGIDRKTSVIALGGGVVGDLAGFAAASLLRGLDFYQVPTSLLAMVDSSVGGKTGINATAGKNLIGAFHQPRHVLIDPSTLVDLAARELRAGYAELVKHALIKDSALLAWLDSRLERIIGDRDLGLLGEAITQSVRIKAAVVSEDERETGGARALLNFGHTFAHAFEAIAGYDGRLLHGEAVALGMVKALTFSLRAGCCDGADADLAIGHLARAGLPVDSARHPAGPFDADAVIARMRIDKKAVSGQINLVLSEGIGSAFLAHNVDPSEIKRVL